MPKMNLLQRGAKKGRISVRFGCNRNGFTTIMQRGSYGHCNPVEC